MNRRPAASPDPQPAAGPEIDREAFTHAVMAAIRPLSQPTPVRSFMSALRGWSWPDAVASLWVAWHLATVRGVSVAPRVRARSLALVLAVASVLATGSIVAAAAVRVALPERAVLPAVAAPPADDALRPVVEGPIDDGRDEDHEQVPPPPAALPGPVQTEPTARPANHKADDPAATDRASDEGDHEGDGAHSGSDPDAHDGSDRADDGDRSGHEDADTERHDGSRDDPGLDGAETDSGHGGDSGDDGRD